MMVRDVVLDRWRLALHAAAFFALVLFVAETETLSLDELHSSHIDDDSDSLQRALDAVENRRLVLERLSNVDSRQPWKRYVKNERYEDDLSALNKKKRAFDVSRLFHPPLQHSTSRGRQEVNPPELLQEKAVEVTEKRAEGSDSDSENGNEPQDLVKNGEQTKSGEKKGDGTEEEKRRKKDYSGESGNDGDQKATVSPEEGISRKTEEGDGIKEQSAENIDLMKVKRQRDSDSSRLRKLQSLSYRDLKKRSKRLNSFSPGGEILLGSSPHRYDNSRKRKRTFRSREFSQANELGERYKKGAKRSFKRQFSLSEAKREDENKHQQVWKRGEPSNGDENIMGELSEILSDGKSSQDVRKREVDEIEKKSKPELDAKDTNNHSDSIVEGGKTTEEVPDVGKPLNDETAQMDSSDQRTAVNDKEAFYNWLQNEYFKTMARSMVSAKRKRSDWIPMVAVDVDHNQPSTPKNLKTEEVRETVKARIESINDDESELGKKLKSSRLKDITDKMQLIEKAMVEDALSLIANGAAHEGKDSEKDMARIVDKLGAAYDVKQLRGALNDLEETFARMGDKKVSSSEVSSEEDNDEDNEIRRKKMDIRQQDSDSGEEYNSIRSAPEMYTGELPLDDEFGPPFPSVFSERDLDNEVDGSPDMMNERSSWRSCPALQLLTSDCSALDSLIPRGRAGELLMRVCNWHEVCYTCGEAFGLEARDCDGGFVQETETICVNDIPCKTTARMMLLPLRERRVFYKRSIPDTCYMDPCVEAFLQRN